MLEKARRLLFDELSHHVAEDSANSIEAFVGRANVIEPIVVQQDLLDNKDGHSLAKLRASLHNPQAERNDLSCEEEVDDFRRVILHECSDNAE